MFVRHGLRRIALVHPPFFMATSGFSCSATFIAYILSLYRIRFGGYLYFPISSPSWHASTEAFVQHVQAPVLYSRFVLYGNCLSWPSKGLMRMSYSVHLGYSWLAQCLVKANCGSSCVNYLYAFAGEETVRIDREDFHRNNTQPV